MITGDHPQTAAAIARQAGLPHEEILTGDDIARMDAATLATHTSRVNIFARVKPEQKLALVEALKAQQEVVAMISAAQPRSATLFIDSCYSGQSRSGEALLPDARPLSLRSSITSYPPEFSVLSASSAQQISWSSAELGHGLFSYYLMKGLEGPADLDRDGAITFGEMQRYLVENVARQAATRNRTQEPQLIGDEQRTLVKR